MTDLARLRAHAKAIADQPTAATWNYYTRERVVQRAREMLELLDGAVLLSGEEASVVMQFVKARRLSHYTHDATSSGCCPNCDQRKRESATCGRCGARFVDWLGARCRDSAADDLRALLASGRPGEEQA